LGDVWGELLGGVLGEIASCALRVGTETAVSRPPFLVDAPGEMVRSDEWPKLCERALAAAHVSLALRFRF